jgi:ferritin-like metal-binding protein YciE
MKKMKKTAVMHVQNDSQIKHRANAEMEKSAFAQSLHYLFLDELKNAYWSEKALFIAIPNMINQTTSLKLREMLSQHLAIIEEHATRLEEVFSSINEKIESLRCEAMEGLIKEAQKIMQMTEKGKLRDAGIISAALKVEHYEIATYGTLCFFAKTLGEIDAAALLHKTLEQEKQANEKLSEIIESMHLEIADSSGPTNH